MFFIGIAFVVLAIFVMSVVVIGLFKFKNQLTMLHIISLHDMLCVPLISIGCFFLLLQQKQYTHVLKMLLIVVFFLTSNPIVSHAISKSLLDYKKVPNDIKH